MTSNTANNLGSAGKTALAALALAYATPAAASETDWTYIGTTDSGTVIHARTADLLKGRSDQTVAPVWLRYDASSDRTIAFKEARAMVVINCVARTAMHVQGTAYFRDGTVERTGSREVRFIVPDSNMDTVATMLCTDPAPQPNYR